MDPLKLMRRAVITCCILWLGAACGFAGGHPAAHGRASPSEFDQPLPEPALRAVAAAPSGSAALAGLQKSGLRSAQFRIVGTEQAPRPQGRIGAQVYHLGGRLTVNPSALELQPWDDPMAGSQPDIDGRGDFVSIGSVVYVRINTMNAWQVLASTDPYWSVFANVNPSTWTRAANATTLGEASIGGTIAWVVRASDSNGQQFKVWLRETDGYPLRYTMAWRNAKGSTYYVNALYAQFNADIGIAAPDLSNRGIVSPHTAVALPDGSVTVTDTSFDCIGTALRRPAFRHKFVLITLAFVDTGPGEISIAPDSWRLYGDGTDGASSIDVGTTGLLRRQTLSPGHQLSGVVAFEVPEDSYQLWTVGKLTGATVVVSTFLSMYPEGQSPCAPA